MKWDGAKSLGEINWRINQFARVCTVVKSVMDKKAGKRN